MRIRSLLVVIAVTVIAVGSCHAAKCPPGKELKLWGSLDSKPKTAEAYKPDKVEIGIGSYKLLELRGPAAGYTLPEREVAVYNRLVEALSIGQVTPGMVCVGKVRSAPTIYVGPVRFISVYRQDAIRANTTQEALAQEWRDRLAQVLPKLTAPTADRIRPGGGVAGSYEVAVGGVLLFRLRGPDGFASVTARGVAVEGQIVKALSDGKYVPSTASAVAAGKEWVVMFRGLRLVTATEQDAAANGTTMEKLAKSWAAALNAALPRLKGPTGETTTQ